MTDATRLLQQAAELRKQALTPEQRERRRVNDERSDRIQRLGVKAKDGVTFAKKGKS